MFDEPQDVAIPCDAFAFESSAMLYATILPVNSQKKFRPVLFFAGLILFFAASAFLNVGRWLVVEDPLQKSDAIAVLSGRMPSRALEAARLYGAGYAPEVWLTYSSGPAAELAKLSVPYEGEEHYDKLILIHEGVPESAIRILEPPIENTADEIRAISQSMQVRHASAVIIVTSKVHTRRTRALWKKLAASNIHVIVRGVSDDEFDPAHWWRNTGDALDVVREVLGMLNVWAGLPLRPAK
jgi:uncharacterized SAM-binding protein YcdF (DUF218 family)